MSDKMVTAARLALGLAFVVFGLDYFLHYLPDPGASQQGGAFLEALWVTGYMFPMIKVIETACGALLLLGLYVPLALLLLAPVLVNVVMYHVMLDPSILRPVALVLMALELYLAWQYRQSFRGVFELRARPAHS